VKDWDLSQDQFFLNLLLKQAQEVPVATPAITPQIAEVAHNLALALKNQISDAPVEVSFDKQILDSFSNLDFNDHQPFSTGRGGIFLFGKDLKDLSSLNDWLQANHATANQMPFQDFDSHANHCVVMHVLYQRASNLLTNAGPAKKALFQHYLDQISVISKTAKSPDGKACSLVSADDKTAPKEPPSDVKVEQLRQEIISNPPFNSQQINTDNILLFAQKYAELAPNDPQVHTALQTIQNSIQSLERSMNAPSTFIPMDNFNDVSVKGMSSNATNFLSALYNLVLSAYSLYGKFVNQTKDQVSSDASRILQQQLFPAQSNLNHIGSVQKNYAEALQRTIQQSQHR